MDFSSAEGPMTLSEAMQQFVLGTVTSAFRLAWLAPGLNLQLLTQGSWPVPEESVMRRHYKDRTDRSSCDIGVFIPTIQELAATDWYVF